MINQVTPQQADQLIKESSAIVIDIRDANSFAQGHIEGATRIDNDNFQAFRPCWRWDKRLQRLI